MPAEQFANAAQTTLVDAIDNVVTTLTVNASPSRPFPSTPQFRIRIDDELFLVTAVAGVTWTVSRAVEGPGTASSHSAGAVVTQVLTAAAVSALVPAGTIMPFAGLSVPDGWLECDGSAKNRSDFSALFSVLSATRTGTTTNGSAIVTGLSSTSDIQVGFQVSGTGIPAGAKVAAIASGSSITLSTSATASGSPTLVFTAWGAGDGSTTFNIPDLRRRTLVGSGGTGTVTLGSALGNTGGSETHTLIGTEMPVHSHQLANRIMFALLASGGNRADLAAGTKVIGTDSLATHTLNAGGSSGATQPHNNVQPSAVVRWVIKA